MLTNEIEKDFIISNFKFLEYSKIESEKMETEMEMEIKTEIEKIYCYDEIEFDFPFKHKDLINFINNEITILNTEKNYILKIFQVVGPSYSGKFTSIKKNCQKYKVDLLFFEQPYFISLIKLDVPNFFLKLNDFLDSYKEKDLVLCFEYIEKFIKDDTIFFSHLYAFINGLKDKKINLVIYFLENIAIDFEIFDKFVASLIGKQYFFNYIKSNERHELINNFYENNNIKNIIESNFFEMLFDIDLIFDDEFLMFYKKEFSGDSEKILNYSIEVILEIYNNIINKGYLFPYNINELIQKIGYETEYFTFKQIKSLLSGYIDYCFNSSGDFETVDFIYNERKHKILFEKIIQPTVFKKQIYFIFLLKNPRNIFNYIKTNLIQSKVAIDNKFFYDFETQHIINIFREAEMGVDEGIDTLNFFDFKIEILSSTTTFVILKFILNTNRHIKQLFEVNNNDDNDNSINTMNSLDNKFNINLYLKTNISLKCISGDFIMLPEIPINFEDFKQSNSNDGFYEKSGYCSIEIEKQFEIKYLIKSVSNSTWALKINYLYFNLFPLLIEFGNFCN